MFAAWRDALVTFFTDFMEQHAESAACTTGAKSSSSACTFTSHLLTTSRNGTTSARDVFGPFRRRNTGSDVNNVFWKLLQGDPRPGAQGPARRRSDQASIRPDVNIYAVYQCLLNAIPGTTIYENVSFGVSPVDVVQFTGELLVSYIKNEPDASVLAGKRKGVDM